MSKIINLIRKSGIMFILILAASCKPNSKATTEITKTHYNIFIVSDLSNRVNNKLYPKPINDTVIIKKFVQNFDSVIHLGRQSMNQKDRLHYRVVNKQFYNLMPHGITNFTNIDVSRFDQDGKQSKRIDYINDTMQEDLQKMYGIINQFYDSASNHQFGADIWTYLNTFEPYINLNLSDTSTINNQEEGLTVHHKISNIMILFTDGYIEAGLYGKGYDLSKLKVDKIRQNFIKSKASDLSNFLDQFPEFQITPLKNKEIKDLNLMVLEAYDRSLTKSGSATIHPTDFEILQEVWKKWMEKSGVKSFEIHSYVGDIKEANDLFFGFLKKSRYLN